MNSLIKIEDLLPSLTPIEKKVVLASQSESLNKCNTNVIEDLLVDCVAKASIILAHKVSANDISIISQELSARIKQELPYMKIDEVAIAISNGSYGKYKKSDNDVIHVSAANMLSWLNSYNIEKHIALKKQIDFQQKEIYRIKELENKEIMKREFDRRFPSMVKESFNTWKEQKVMNNMTFVIYTRLEELGIISYTKEVKLKIYSEAVDMQKRICSKGGVRFNENYMMPDLKDISRQIALSRWYNLMIEQEEDVEKLILDFNK